MKPGAGSFWRGDFFFIAALYAVLGGALFYLVWDLRPYPILGWVDDYLYVHSAWHLKNFHWLGPFDAMTLVKRPLFGAVLAATSILHLPFTQFQMFFYLAGAAFFIHSLLRLGMPRALALLVFAVSAFVPTIYDSNGSRVLRETSSIAMELFAFGLLLRLWRLPRGTSLKTVLTTRQGATLYAAYALGAFHWGMREEAFLLTLSAAPFLWVVGFARLEGGRARRGIGGLVLAGGWLAALLLMKLLISSLNFAAYRVFLVNDLSQGAFPKAVGLLKSIEEGPRPQLLLEPAETDKLRELSPHFRRVGDILHIAQRNVPDLDYSHQMFFLRVSALRESELGRSARQTQDYFDRLATVVAGLCAEGKLACDPDPRSSVIPKFNAEQKRRVPEMFSQLGRYILGTEHSGFEFKSHKTPGVEAAPEFVLKRYENITRQKLFGWDGGPQAEFKAPAPLDVLAAQRARRQKMGDFYSRWSPPLHRAAAVALVVFCALLWKAPKRVWWWVIPLLLTHVFARLGAFSYLGAIDGDIPSRLMTPIYPFALALAVLTLGAAVTAAAGLARRAPAAGSATGAPRKRSVAAASPIL
jgi:hypothetical protein